VFVDPFSKLSSNKSVIGTKRVTAWVSTFYVATKACRKKSILRVLKVDKKRPNFMGRAFKLKFPALHSSKFAAYFSGRQILGPGKSV